LSQAEDPSRMLREQSAGEVTVEDVRVLMGASTPHFALQLRDRVATLIADLPPEHPARIEGERVRRLGDDVGGNAVKGQNQQNRHPAQISEWQAGFGHSLKSLKCRRRRGETRRRCRRIHRLR